jgi:acid phosphatase type 7
MKNNHYTNVWITWTLALFLFSGATLLVAQQEEDKNSPAGLFLTWQNDPTTTMTIDWHTKPGDEAKLTLDYKKTGNNEWTTVSASQHVFPYSDRTIHRVELTGLHPNTYYHFRVGEFERVYKFRTMPQTNHRPVRFGAGGDTSIGEIFKEMNLTVMKYDPDFIVWGGDLAYANAREENLHRWISWFERVQQDLITEEGRVVPLILAIGNHEMIDHHYPYSDATARRMGIGEEMELKYERGEIPESTREWREENAPYFYNLFAFPGHPGYGVLDFGNYLSLIILDGSHSNLIGGRQTEWLEDVLKSRKGIPHLIPVYHKPAYPSYRVQPGGIPNQIWPKQVLQFWVPLFEKHGVRVALEHDDHAYKRTYPLLNNKIDPAGIVYIGDGAWGVGTREPLGPEDVWYLKRSAKENHAIIVTLHGPHQHFLIVNNDGEVIDEYPETP